MFFFFFFWLIVLHRAVFCPVICLWFSMGFFCVCVFFHGAVFCLACVICLAFSCKWYLSLMLHNVFYNFSISVTHRSQECVQWSVLSLDSSLWLWVLLLLLFLSSVTIKATSFKLWKYLISESQWCDVMPRHEHAHNALRSLELCTAITLPLTLDIHAGSYETDPFQGHGSSDGIAWMQPLRPRLQRTKLSKILFKTCSRAEHSFACHACCQEL